MVLRRPSSRLTIGRLLLAIAIGTPLLVALSGFVTGFRCPLCFSGRVIPVYFNEIGCGWAEQEERGEIHIEYGADPARTRWYCRACGLQW